MSSLPGLNWIYILNSFENGTTICTNITYIKKRHFYVERKYVHYPIGDKALVYLTKHSSSNIKTFAGLVQVIKIL